jgi:formylglycine-generating enzyme required for sulfatase activity
MKTNMRLTKIVHKCTIVFVLLFLTQNLLAHENNIVHPGLTNAAITAADIPEITARGFFNLSTDSECSFIDEGSVKEDLAATSFESWNTSVWGTNACALLGLNWINHSYNPVTGNGWWDLGGIDTVTYAAPIWYQALADYSSSNFDDAYFGLGRVCHLLEDMTSPAHTHGDVHAAGDDFENWGETNFSSYNFAAVMPYIPSGTVTLPDSSQVAGHSIEGFLHSLAEFTYDLSAFHGHLEEIEGTQPDSELARMFPTLHYYDGGILGDNYWEIDDIGGFEQTGNDEWWACEDDYTEDNGGTGGARRIIGNFYIENSAGDSGTLTPAVFEKTGVYVANPNTKTLVQIYGDILFPKTVSYVAGLFYVFTDTVHDQPQLYFPANNQFAKGTNITFFWMQTAGANNYHLQVALDSGFSNTVFDANVGDTTSVELTGFPDNGTTKFYWRIKAGNPAGWSSYSYYWVFTNGCMRSDFDSDCDADFDDLAIFVSHWLDTGCTSFDLCQGTDLIRSSDVDFKDFAAFAENWQKSTLPPPSQPDTVFIPGGTFQMGDSFGDGGSWERPVHIVTLDSFYMGKYEITNQQYCAYLNSALQQGLITVTSGIVYKADSGTSYPYCSTSSAPTGYPNFGDYSRIVYSSGVFSIRTYYDRSMENDPMVCVSWYGAVAYCNWRSQQEAKGQCYNLSTWACDFNKKGYRLATEAEWEYAARGGLSGKRFPWGDTISHSQANYNSFWIGGHPYYPYDVSPTQGYHPFYNSFTAPVGSFSANGFGLFDMSGNVYEWCNDWWSSTYYSSSPVNNPTGPTSGDGRIRRGGNWGDGAGSSQCRVAGRQYSSNLGLTHNYFGFRILLDFP